MEPTQPSRSEELIPDSSPDRPSLNGTEHAQRAFPSPILRSSTLLILSPTPTRPQPSLVAEAGSTTTVQIELGTTPSGFLTEIDQYADRRSSPVMPPGHGLRHLGEPCQSKHEHLEKEGSEGFEKEKEKKKEEEEARERELARQRQQRRARKHTSRRTQPFSAEALANTLSTINMDEPEQRDSHEDYNQYMKRWGRGFRARYRFKVREQALARRMRDVERRIQGRVEGIGMDVDGGEGGSGNGNTATEVQRTDTNSAHGAPTQDGDVQMSSVQSTSHPHS